MILKKDAILFYLFHRRFSSEPNETKDEMQIAINSGHEIKWVERNGLNGCLQVYNNNMDQLHDSSLLHYIKSMNIISSKLP